MDGRITHAQDQDDGGPDPTSPRGHTASDDPTEHAGKWLAWSEDESRVLAVGDSAEEIRAAVERAGHPRFIYDWVPPAELRQTTGLA